MAFYSDTEHLHRCDDEAFNELFKPGQKPPRSGIYRCKACGYEIVAETSRSFPSTHASHDPNDKILWELIVKAKHKTT